MEEFHTDYQPTIVDVIWAQSMVDMIRDNGVLVFPATQLVYQLHHSVKVIELVNINIFKEHPELKELHGRSHVVFEMIGWKVLP